MTEDLYRQLAEQQETIAHLTLRLVNALEELRQIKSGELMRISSLKDTGVKGQCPVCFRKFYNDRNLKVHRAQIKECRFTID